MKISEPRSFGSAQLSFSRQRSDSYQPAPLGHGRSAPQQLSPQPSPQAMLRNNTSVLSTAGIDVPARPRFAASYARKSDQDSDGIEAQHEITRRAAARDGYEIPDELCFSDDHTSGVTTSRNGLDTLIQLIESGSAPFEAIYVRNRKRLGRWNDPGMHDYLRIHMSRFGVTLRYAEGVNPDYTKGMDPEVVVQSLFDRMETIDASTERAETRRRVMTGTRRRVVQGFWPGSIAPYATQRWLANLATGKLIRPVEEGVVV